MKQVTVIILATFLLFGCMEASNNINAPLDGIWILDKAKTWPNVVKSNISKEELWAYSKSFGVTGYSFRNNILALVFIGDEHYEPIYSKFTVVKISEQIFMVTDNGGNQMKIELIDNCFSTSSIYGFREYYCKQNENV